MFEGALKKISFNFGKTPIKVTEDVIPKLRDDIIRIVHHAHLDFAPEYIYADKSEKNPDLLAIDGLIRTTAGYFRLAEDTENNNRVLLFSPTAENLIGEWGQDQILHIKKKPTKNATEEKFNDDVHIVSAKSCDVSGSHFREDMNHFTKEFKRKNLFDLNLAMKEIPPSEERMHNGAYLKGYQLTNNKAAIELLETETGKWKMRLLSNLRGDWDETGCFVRGKESLPKDPLWKNVFHPSNEYKEEFDDFFEALTEAKKYWHKSALRLWKGQNLLSDMVPKKGFAAKIYKAKKFILSIKDNKKLQRSFVVSGIGAIVTSAAGFFFAPAIVGTVAMGFAVAVGGGLVTGIGMKVIEDISTRLINKFKSKDDKTKIDTKKASIDQDLSPEYIDPTSANKKRFCKKITQNKLSKLRLLTQKEAGMNYDLGTKTSIQRENWVANSILSIPERVFGSVSEPLNKNTIITHYPNGLLILMHVNYKSKKTTNIVTYNEKLVVGKSAPLQPEIKNMLKNGKVLEITHDAENAPAIRELTENKLRNKLGYIFNKESKKVRKIKIKDLSNIFNPPKPKKEEKVIKAIPAAAPSPATIQ